MQPGSGPESVSDSEAASAAQCRSSPVTVATAGRGPARAGATVGRRATPGGHPVTDRGGLPLARSHAVSRIAPDGGGRVRRLDTAGVRRQGQTRTEQGRRLGPYFDQSSRTEFSCHEHDIYVEMYTIYVEKVVKTIFIKLS
jgi:hypothetical protein